MTNRQICYGALGALEEYPLPLKRSLAISGNSIHASKKRVGYTNYNPLLKLNHNNTGRGKIEFWLVLTVSLVFTATGCLTRYSLRSKWVTQIVLMSRLPEDRTERIFGMSNATLPLFSKGVKVSSNLSSLSNVFLSICCHISSPVNAEIHTLGSTRQNLGEIIKVLSLNPFILSQT
jgi:hypothetical protein